MGLDVRFGYYGMWGATRDCDTYLPENIPAGALTHINLAFEYVSEDHEITDTQGPIVARASRLKKKYPGLRVNIALGGWVFNDPPTQYRFSEMASITPNREKFIASLIRYIRRYGLNGVDIGS
ncbi:glycoside hydrolase [Penicillium nucicola]|uniref:glycoside hydrolase n=1 Tax=Penicillium nucicola TaxID=1850975 RepID=UPI002545050C|nr:glycoside hydrolase [Penicillium nucicola]KAJ5762211.1 glycoside hydrolase [Penicillium nucicola]